jgi:hypothetical protein
MKELFAFKNVCHVCAKPIQTPISIINKEKQESGKGSSVTRCPEQCYPHKATKSDFNLAKTIKNFIKKI